MLANRFTSTLVFITVLLIFANSPSGALEDALEKPPEYTILNSGSELDYPPFAVVQKDGTAGGFSVDLLKAVVRAVGMDVSFVVGPWNEVKQGLINGDFDVLPLVSYSEKRDEVMDFTAPYLRMHGSIFVRKGEKTIRGEADLKDKEVLVMRGDTAHEYAVSKNLSDKLILTDTFEEAMKRLSQGKHDALIIQQLVGFQLIKKLNISNITDIGFLKTSTLKPMATPLSGFEQKFCIAVQDGNKELLSLLNEGLTIVITNGIYEELYNKWFTAILPKPSIDIALTVKYLLFFLIPFFLCIGVIAVWYFKREVARKTQVLNEEIKERKQIEDALRGSEERLRAIFNAAETVSFIITNARDPEPSILEFSPGAEKIFGYMKSEVIGKSVAILHLPDDIQKFPEMHQKMKAGKTGFSGETTQIRKSGEKFPALFSTYPLCDKKGNMYAALGISFDISEQKRLESQLIQAQKMESVGRLAGGVAHDFNNMLSIILGNTEIIIDDMPPDNEFLNNLGEIKKAAERSTDLVKQLLAFARKQTITPRVLILNTTLESMLKMLQRLIGEDIDLAWRPEKKLWPVKIDPSQVDQILANLCVNARDAIKGVGKVTIETNNVVLNDEYCREHAGFHPGNYVMIAVSDSGYGMKKETLANLFEPFFTTKEMGRGVGLGLATVYGIVKQNNGFINVYSEPGKGTTFKIYLPRHVDEVIQKKRENSIPGIPTGNETILLVEDEQAILRMTKIMLERLGYTVLDAATPGEAIRISESRYSDIHMLMTDVVMPEMSGRDLAETLLKLYPGIKCLFMSGYTANVIAHHGVLDKGVHFIHKPFTKHTLAAKLREVLE